MSRRLLMVAAVIVLSIAAFWAYTQAHQAPAPVSGLEQNALDEDLAITASGTLSPERCAYLASRSGGRVESVDVTAGQKVSAGDVLIQLAAAGLRAGVAQAEATLAASQADLARLRAGARSEEITRARAVLAAAQAAPAKLQAGARPGEIAQAKAAVAAAEARLAIVRSGLRPEQIAVTKAQVRQAETTLARAQETYDTVRWVGGETEREARYQRDAAGTALAVVKAQLAVVEDPPSADEIAAAQAAVDQAQAQRLSLPAKTSTRPRPSSTFSKQGQRQKRSLRLRLVPTQLRLPLTRRAPCWLRRRSRRPSPARSPRCHLAVAKWQRRVSRWSYWPTFPPCECRPTT